VGGRRLTPSIGTLPWKPTSPQPLTVSFSFSSSSPPSSSPFPFFLFYFFPFFFNFFDFFDFAVNLRGKSSKKHTVVRGFSALNKGG
jgi:hypothetical protein